MHLLDRNSSYTRCGRFSAVHRTPCAVFYQSCSVCPSIMQQTVARFIETVLVTDFDTFEGNCMFVDEAQYEKVNQSLCRHFTMTIDTPWDVGFFYSSVGTTS